MNAPEATSADSCREKTELRTEHKSTAVADRVRTLLGGTDQADLADRVGKEDSTISDHLSGTANLTLGTIAEYEAALENAVVMVPNIDRSGRRRRRASSKNGMSKQRREMKENIEPAKRRLHRLLTNVAARIGQILSEQEDMNQQALASRLGKGPSYISRVLGGGVNLTLKTIVQFEKELGACILQVKGTPIKGTFSGKREASGYVHPYHSSNDGCYLDDNGGRTSTGMTEWLETRNESRVSEGSEMVAA